MISESFSSVRDALLETGHGVTSCFRRLASQSKLASLDARDRAIVEALESDAGYATHLDQLGAPGSAELITAADQLQGSGAPFA